MPRLRFAFPAGAGRRAPRSVIPGFRLSLGLTLLYLGLIVMLPIGALLLKAADVGFWGYIAIITSPRTLASFQITITTAAAAALFNAVYGLGLAWVLVRYEFPGKRLLDAMVDVPFALPTAVAGLAMTAIFANNGWLGEPLAAWFGWTVAFRPAGVVVALVFVALPFIARTVEPVLRDLPRETEEAAATLGATRVQTIARVVLPALAPALLTGFGLGFARAVGEYGSVIFIAGNMPMVSEILPLLIVVKLEQFDYAGAAAIGLAMLLLAFVILLGLNLLQLLLRRGRP